MPARSPTGHDVPVVIVGAGPVGLSLALALARHGVESALIEREATTSERSKAPGIHVRTRESFRRWGVEDRFLAAGRLQREMCLHDAGGGRTLLRLDFEELADEAHEPGVLILEQGETERLLCESVRGSGWCDVRFDAEVVALVADDDGVTLTVREGAAERSLRAAYAVGCDGASSFVRDALGWDFAGSTYRVEPVLADVVVDDDRDALPWPRIRNDRDGLSAALQLRPGLWRIIRLQRGDPDAGDVPDGAVQRHVAEVLGPGGVEVVWASRFRIHRRSVDRFRRGRVLLAGDAAHVHSPVGGQGMNAGIQDADNLAWKLAAALSGGDVDRLLDSYDVERRGVVVGSVSRFTDVMTRVFLQTPVAVRRAAFGALRTALMVPPARRRALRRGAMLDLTAPPSPLLDASDRAAGVRLPNSLVVPPGGTAVRLHDLLPVGPALLRVGPETDPHVGDLPVEAVLRIGPGGHTEPAGSLRDLLGGRDGWILVRPDGCAAWARTAPDGLEAAIRRSLGMPQPPA